jgi:hypothetical protein
MGNFCYYPIIIDVTKILWLLLCYWIFITFAPAYEQKNQIYMGFEHHHDDAYLMRTVVLALQPVSLFDSGYRPQYADGM